ncbi:THAP domain-containing protein 4-like [Centruroides sculpturatus]|uniref:THAP domain-containing protein 4-like n=1 Tax=Centruroides sculpturatus TaxID=218467 RepID=UPI000C6CBFF8|nr:THAP domain-containing protein 4-like [Centruroides sculpturatus]
MPCCSAPNCANSDGKGYRMFRFPADQNRRKVWVVRTRRDKWQPTSSSRLCEIHFTEEQFENNRVDGKRKLRPDAVPTLFGNSNENQVSGVKRLKVCEESRITVGVEEMKTKESCTIENSFTPRPSELTVLTCKNNTIDNSLHISKENIPNCDDVHPPTNLDQTGMHCSM